MQTLVTMGSVWAVITVVFFVLLIYRRNLVSKETAWIPLTEDAKEDSAIKAQSVIETKTQKLTVPIRTLGTVSLLLFLVMLGFWIYHSIFTPPPMPQ